MINVVWQTYNNKVPNRGYWDQALLEDLLAGDDFNHLENNGKLPDLGGAIVIIPARSHYNLINIIDKDLAKLDWCLLIITGDEDNQFNYDGIKHPNIIKYGQLPRTDSKADYYLPNGYTPNTRPMLAKLDGQKNQDWFFAGQVTHKRRQDCVDVLKTREDGQLVETEGFTQGIAPVAYYEALAAARIAPCPSGPETVDTFRLYEALEAGCIPAVDTKTPKEDQKYFWKLLLGEHPLTLIDEWEFLPGHIDSLLEDFQYKANHVFNWWQWHKRTIRDRLADDLDKLTGRKELPASDNDLITVLIPTSPIPGLPETKYIDEVISSVRSHLPKAQIIIMADGIREEQAKYKADYDEYIRRLLWRANFKWDNTNLLIFDEHQHQAAMTRKALKLVKTPFILFCEHDTPLTPDEPIPFIAMSKTIFEGAADLIRLHFEAAIPEAHRSLMLGTFTNNGQRYMKTVQWSQRPHLVSKAFYERILRVNFSAHSRTMIEDVMHGVVMDEYNNHGVLGWNNFKLAIYYPEGNIKRSYHTDGRQGDLKYDDRYIR